MIWELDDWDAMTRRIFAEVWVSMRIAYSWPRHILTRWTTAPRGKSLSLPLPRSWLGGRCADPPPHTTHTLTEWTHTMRKLLASALLIASLTGCATTSALTEDDPGWDCATMGNRICTPLDTRTTTQETAWDIWDNGGGSSKLKVDNSRPYRVDFVGASDTYPHQAPADDALAVGKDGRWYWFHLTYTD